MTRYLLSTLGAVALLAACSGGNNTLGAPGGGDDPTAGGDTQQQPDNSNAADTSGSTGGSTQSNPAPPQQGPGSSGSPAHEFYVKSVHPSLQTTCGTCHNNGSAGAPKMMNPDATLSYQALDARGLIVDNTLILRKGSHAGGAAPALDTTQQGLVTQWIQLEMKERVGQAAPVNILDKIGGCFDQTKFQAIGFQNLKTTPRTNENTDRCEGCNNVQCKTCHTGGDGGFYMAIGSNLDQNTFAMSKTPDYIVKYIGLNGTDPVPSNALKAKSDATKTAPPYSHPMFTLSTTMQTNLDAFVNDAITRYKAKQCGQ